MKTFTIYTKREMEVIQFHNLPRPMSTVCTNYKAKSFGMLQILRKIHCELAKARTDSSGHYLTWSTNII